MPAPEMPRFRDEPAIPASTMFRCPVCGQPLTGELYEAEVEPVPEAEVEAFGGDIVMRWSRPTGRYWMTYQPCGCRLEAHHAPDR